MCKPILENKGVEYDRSRTVANSSVSTLNLDEKMIYEKLQHAGNSGIWKETTTKTIEYSAKRNDESLEISRRQKNHQKSKISQGTPNE